MSDFDYNVDLPMNGELLQSINAIAQRMADAETNMLDAEKAYKAAKEEYELLKTSTLPSFFTMHGLSVIGLQSGKTLTIEDKYACSPNKNEADRRTLVAFLEKYNGDSIVKKEHVVPDAELEALKESGIAFKTKEEVNTNTLKKFLKEGLGVGGAPSRFEEKDIPKCANFYKWKEAKIS
jgi:hypothetical protein